MGPFCCNFGQLWHKILINAVLILLTGGGISPAAFATSLEQAVRTALISHPQIKSAEAKRQASAHDLREAKGGYYPTVDLSGNLGREHTDIYQFKETGDRSKSLTTREVGLSMSLMVYDGKATTSEVDRRSALLEAAGKDAASTHESVAFRAVEVYLDVLEGQRLVALAEENVGSHRQTLQKVRLGAERGVSQKADVAQARGRLALAQSALVAREGKLREAELKYRRVIGEMPDGLLEPAVNSSNLLQEKSISDDSLRLAITEGIQTALSENPSLQAARSEVDAAKAAVRGAKAAYLPRVDLQVKVNRDDNIAGVVGGRDSEAIMLVASWNVYRGGADQAREKALVKRHFAAKDTAVDTQRQVEEAVAIALKAKATSEMRLFFLEEHVKASEETLKSYQAQFKLGRRSLLDMLNAKNELFSASSNLVAGRYDDLLNQYFVDASQGVLNNRLGTAVE